MYDKYKRKIDYLRISVTDRCNLHCSYCQPEVARRVTHEQILRYEEILRICRLAVRLGISKFKITGGEPLMRKDCAQFIAALKQLDGVEQVTLTTNGTLLPKFLPKLLDAGLDSANISLDTTETAQYKQLTGGELAAVLAGMDAAKKAGLPFKLNCVPLVSMGVCEIMQLLELAEAYQAPMRFIELMPLACNTKLQGIAGSTIRKLLEQSGLKLTPTRAVYGNGPASYYRVGGYTIPVGFIEPIHNRFCASCNRVRLTSVGYLKTCLYSDAGVDIGQIVRSGISDAELERVLQQTIFAKPRSHSFDARPAQFNMSQIGG